MVFARLHSSSGSCSNISDPPCIACVYERQLRLQLLSLRAFLPVEFLEAAERLLGCPDARQQDPHELLLHLHSAVDFEEAAVSEIQRLSSKPVLYKLGDNIGRFCLDKAIV